jgi:hypothetical protein
MEVAGLVVGIAGLAAVFETGCEIWLTVAKASQYGESVANALSKLEMEVFKFQAWWVVLERMAADPRKQAPHSGRVAKASSMSSSNLNLTRQLRESCKHPILNAATAIQRLLEQLQDILEKNGALEARDAAANLPKDKPAMSEPAKQGLASSFIAAESRHKALVNRLQGSTPFRKRVLHGARPWAGADKDKIDGILDSITYWNRSLYEILPSNIRESVMIHGMAGYLLESTDDKIEDISITKEVNAQNRVAVECARLVELRKQLRMSGDKTMSTHLRKNLDDMRKTRELSEQLTHITSAEEPFSILRSGEADDCKLTLPFDIVSCKLTPPTATVLVEWYPYPSPQDGIDVRQTATDRMAQLSFLLHRNNRPSTLHSLSALGYVENDPAKAFGLVYELPNAYTAQATPATLHDLLSRKASQDGQPRTLPSLEHRYELAAILASSLYTFMLGRWHHKRFNSHSIFFLPFLNGDHDFGPDISNPYVGGYAISRLDKPQEISLIGPSANDVELYLHPDAQKSDLRSPDEPRERFRRSFDVYSFGILLAEIGFWTTLYNLAGRTKDKSKKVSPPEVRERLIQECESKLACWMGERYRDATLLCLNVELENGLGQSLNDFYLEVVLEVTKCVPSA